MYETLDTESQNIQWLRWRSVHLENHQVQPGFSDVPKGATITVYDKADSQTPIKSLKSDTGGDLSNSTISFDKQPTLLLSYSTPGKEISNTHVAIPQDERKLLQWVLKRDLRRQLTKREKNLTLEVGPPCSIRRGQHELINLTHLRWQYLAATLIKREQSSQSLPWTSSYWCLEGTRTGQDEVEAERSSRLVALLPGNRNRLIQ